MYYAILTGEGGTFYKTLILLETIDFLVNKKEMPRSKMAQ